jgi:metal transporter CNNM
LCTLLLFNASANETLPLFLDNIVPSWAAILFSVSLVLLCGEVIPSALFTGPDQLMFAAKFVPVVYVLEIIFYPIAYPMAKALDYILGEDEEDQYNRDEISAMVNIIRDEGLKSEKLKLQLGYNPPTENENEDILSENEASVITGVLGLAKIKIRDVCVKLAKVNMLSTEQVLDSITIDAIDKVGHSRLPVFQGTDRQNIIGFFLVKKLLNVNPEKSIPLSSMELNEPMIVNANDSLLDALNILKSGQSHLAIVSERPNELKLSMINKMSPSIESAPLGIITIEDIFESMIQSQIFDEEDRAKSLHQAEASEALREMSMRSSMRPSDLELIKEIRSIDPIAINRVHEGHKKNQQKKDWTFPRSFTEVFNINHEKRSDADDDYHHNANRISIMSDGRLDNPLLADEENGRASMSSYDFRERVHSRGAHFRGGVSAAVVRSYVAKRTTKDNKSLMRTISH